MHQSTKIGINEHTKSTICEGLHARNINSEFELGKTIAMLKHRDGITYNRIMFLLFMPEGIYCKISGIINI